MENKFVDKYSLDQEELIKGYVLGFLFSEDLTEVLLIKKNRPEFQAGRLNGIGGKIEPGESHISCMVREFREETGVEFRDWNYLGSFPAGERGYCQVFYGVGPIDECKSLTDEKLFIAETNYVCIGLPIELLDGVSFLVSECHKKIYKQKNPLYNEPYDIDTKYKPIVENK